jgi:hypothetical protein
MHLTVAHGLKAIVVTAEADGRAAVDRGAPRLEQLEPLVARDRQRLSSM